MTERAWLLNLATEPYARIAALQQELVEQRYQGLISDGMILLEHTPVITLGRRADESHILLPPEQLAAEGVEVRQSERGGDVTYHGPGQLVGYPILHLASYGLGASDYMHRLEDVLASVLADFGIATHRRDDIIGVWVGQNKIAALGVRVRHGITFHGFALNVAPDMRHWSFIVPCGITDGGVTSMARELGEVPPMGTVRERVVYHMACAFGVQLVGTTSEGLELQARRARAAATEASVDRFN